jgi:hypothetical protein
MTVLYERTNKRVKAVMKKQVEDYDTTSSPEYTFTGIDHTAIDMTELTDSQIRKNMIQRIVSDCTIFSSELSEETHGGSSLFEKFNEVYDK